MEYNLPNPEDNIQITKELLDNHLKITNGKVVTRFPPEPNGYLHLGHAKAMYINFNYAKSKSGICYMRFDDTNPEKESQEYIDSILSDVSWLGHKPYKITHTSDYLDQLYNFGIQLIKNDKAYICELDSTTMREQRHNCIDSPYRNRPIEESLKLFDEMKNGKYGENVMTLRLKCNMKSPNPNMRDMVACRVISNENSKLSSNIFFTYDFSHPIVDSLENITHSLCSMEFQTRNELYKWVCDSLKIYKAPQIEYSRLHITHTILSKRKLIELVNNKIVTGWDDPRMPTLQGLRRRGYTAEALNDFCKRIGLSIATTAKVINYELLEECLRQDLDVKAPRAMAIFNPLKVILINVPTDTIQTISALNFPNLGEKSATHKINVGNVIYIDRDDFRVQDSPKYFRLAPNKIVRLKYFGLIKCVDLDQLISSNKNKSIEYDESLGNMNFDEIYCELLPNDYVLPSNQKRVRGTINWVSDIDHYKIEVMKYDHLFPKVLNKSVEWKSQLNMNSKTVINAMVDKSVIDKENTKFQFERVGYFSIDPATTNEKIVMNMITSLKENKDKHL